MDFPSHLFRKLEERKLNDSLRSLTLDSELIDFSSNDYLGFSKSHILFDRVQELQKRYVHCNGSTGSRLLTGNHKFHENLETKLADFFNAEAALLFNSGYDANVGLLSALLQRQDVVYYDAYAHASIRDGIRLSHARSYSFKHNDPTDLRKKLLKTNVEGVVYLIVESVYSMDGDAAPLKELVLLAKEFGCRMIVDEAHSTGIYGLNGAGMVSEQGLEQDIFARVHTFGKALGCHGAAVLGDRLLIQYLINFARSFIYTTAMPVHTVLTIEAALDLLHNPDDRNRLQKNIGYFLEMIRHYKLENRFIKSTSPIQSAIIASPQRAKEISARLLKNRYNAKPILSPTVPKGQERIRFCIHSFNTSDEIQEILYLLSTFA